MKSLLTLVSITYNMSIPSTHLENKLSSLWDVRGSVPSLGQDRIIFLHGIYITNVLIIKSNNIKYITTQ